MPDDKMREWYHRGEHPDAETLKHVGEYVPEVVMAKEDADGEIKPMDFVLLVEGDHRLVGNHPLIQRAFKERIAGRVIARESVVLGDKGDVTVILSRYTGKLCTMCFQYHVQFYPDQEKPFIFWEPFLRRVSIERSGIELI